MLKIKEIVLADGSSLYNLSYDAEWDRLRSTLENRAYIEFYDNGNTILIDKYDIKRIVKADESEDE